MLHVTWVATSTGNDASLIKRPPEPPTERVPRAHGLLTEFAAAKSDCVSASAAIVLHPAVVNALRICGVPTRAPHGSTGTPMLVGN